MTNESNQVGDLIPRPDPSLLTTVQFERGQETQRRELSALRELLVSEMGRIEKVHEEKFKGLETRFAESKIEGKSALDAALRAVTDANDKSERNFTKQIEANEQQTKTITGALNSQVSDVKDRLTAIESGTKGAVDNTTRMMAAAILLLSLGTFAFTALIHINTNPTVVSPIAVPVPPK